MTAWFAQLDLSGTSDAQKRVIQGVADLLSELQPARLNSADQVVEHQRGETWVKLQHDCVPWMRIEFVLNDGWVNFYGVMGHDEAYSPKPEPQDGWEAETIDILADLLQSTFTLETYTLLGKPWRDVLTISAPYDQQSLKSKSLTSLAPLRRWARQAVTQSATFECGGTRILRG